MDVNDCSRRLGFLSFGLIDGEVCISIPGASRNAPSNSSDPKKLGF